MNFHRHRVKYIGYQWISNPQSSAHAKPKTKDLVCYIIKNIKNLFSYRFKLRPPHNIDGGTHFSGGTNLDSGGTFVPPFKLLKYALITCTCTSEIRILRLSFRMSGRHL